MNAHAMNEILRTTTDIVFLLLLLSLTVVVWLAIYNNYNGPRPK